MHNDTYVTDDTTVKHLPISRDGVRLMNPSGTSVSHWHFPKIPGKMNIKLGSYNTCDKDRSVCEN